jgi:hypothetical protein
MNTGQFWTAAASGARRRFRKAKVIQILRIGQCSKAVSSLRSATALHNAK